MKLFIALILLTSVSSVLAHPKHQIHEHGSTNNTDTSDVINYNG